MTGVSDGRPLVVRRPDCALTLPGFMRSLLYSTISTLAIGMDLLFTNEHVQLDSLTGHGGLFKTPIVGQKMLAGALNVPVAVMETAGEGGPWGMALLAAYMVNKAEGETLEEYLQGRVFAGARSTRMEPDPADVAGFSDYMSGYKAALEVEKRAVEVI